MHKLKLTGRLAKYVLSFVLLLGSTLAYSQCTPRVKLADGTWSQTGGVFCEGELIEFEANSTGYTTTVDWDFGNGAKSSDQDPTYGYPLSGTYTVTFEGTGFNGTCTETLNIVIKPAPVIRVGRTNDSDQCFRNNLFCFRDTSHAPEGKIVRQTYVFSNGKRIDYFNPTHYGPDNRIDTTFCCDITDPTGGFFDLVIESEDSSGCVSRITLTDYLYVYPRLGIEFVNITPAPNPGCDSTLGVFQNISLVPLADIDSFEWIFGDGTSIKGDANTNTQWWNGPNNDGIIEHMYRNQGTFDGSLVATAYGCVDTFTWKAAVANIVLNPTIVADPNPACTPDNPIEFSVQDLPSNPGVNGFLWNFGDPPSGPANFDNMTLNPSHTYGAGPWMISLRLIAGPCDRTFYDTIQVVGPGSTIGVPMNRVADTQTYQCVIRDTVCMVNNSSFYQNDWDPSDEHTITFYGDFTFDREFNGFAIGSHDFFFRTWEEDRNGNKIINEVKYAHDDTITQQGFKVYFDAVKDSLAVIDQLTGDTTWSATDYGNGANRNYRHIVNPRLRYVFNYTPPPGGAGVGQGDQTAIPLADEVRSYNPNVWRVWSMGDRFAPQCTTDSRPWVNQNVDLNCNFRIDSVPCHWYTPWDEIYETFQDGRNYTQPYVETRLYKDDTICYQVDIYANDTMIVAGDTILTIPIDSSFTYRGVTIPAGATYPKGKLGNWTVRRTPSCFVGTEVYFDVLKDSFVAVRNYTDTTYHPREWLGDNNPKNQNGSTKWTAVYHDLDLIVPAGVTIEILQLEPAGNGGGGGGGPAPGTITTYTGPGTVTIEPDQQFTVSSKDKVLVAIKVEANEPDTSYAQPSIFPAKEIQFGIPVTVTRSAIFIDSAGHRDKWMLDNANCYNVELWQKDTLHPLMCESTATKSLALTPPNAKGLEWTAGRPCPYLPNRGYFLEFDMADTKPGCTQSWFAVNYDTFTNPVNQGASWTVYNSGGVLAPADPGNPMPFQLPYLIGGNTPTVFGKGYLPGEIGPPGFRTPEGSFTLGLIVGNGLPLTNGTNQHPNAECIDTAYFPDIFRILYMNSAFDIISPEGGDCRYMCPGGTAYYQMQDPIQDSIRTMRWSWGYPGPGIGRGPDFNLYVEQFEYYQPYTGPVAGRNDAGVTYNGEDWLYNYVTRSNFSSFGGVEVIDTIVISILKDWKIVADKRAGNELVKEAFDRFLGIDYNDIPEEDLAYYLGDGTFGCLDTTGLSQFFVFGQAAYHPKSDETTWQIGDRRYRCETYSPLLLQDTTFATAGGMRIPSLRFPGVDSFTAIDSIPNLNRDDCIDIREVTHILHWRDSSLAGFDSLAIDTNGDGNLDMLRGLYKHTYRYPEVVGSEDPCDPLSADKVVWRNANGPMTPTLFLNNTIGCENRSSRILNVGFYNDFWIENNTLCEELNLVVEDSLRYYQCGEEDPQTYPIKEIDFWHDFNRFTNNIETYEADWDSTDGIWDGERSQTLNHTYTEPGKYVMSFVAKDSVGCRDTTYETVYVTKVNAYFPLPDSVRSCEGLMNFTDSSWFIDPCATICPNGDTIGGCEEVITWEWDFGDGTRKSILQNPSHNYSQGGTFTITLRVTSKLGCDEEYSRTINIPGPQPRFEFDLAIIEERDTAFVCVGDSVFLRNTSLGEVNTPTFSMNWGEDSNGPIIRSIPGVDTIYGHAYEEPGTYELYLAQQDEVPGTGDRCTRLFPDTNPDLLTQLRKVVVVIPRPPVSINVEDDTVCVGQLVNLEGILDPLYVRLEWEMGDGEEFSRIVPDNTISHSYSQTGDYEVFLKPDYDRLPDVPKCPDSASVFIHVLDVAADFTIDSTARPLFKFQETATGGDTYEWIFDDGETATGPTAEKNYGTQKGTFTVCLIVREANFGCEDTTCKTVSNTFIPELIPYNVFTPNNDGTNDEFIIDNEEIEDYSIKIFNRWGELVFESESSDLHWNGKVNNDGADCPEGTYFYILNYKFNFGQENEPIEGTVELIRNEQK